MIETKTQLKTRQLHIFGAFLTNRQKHFSVFSALAALTRVPFIVNSSLQGNELTPLNYVTLGMATIGSLYLANRYVNPASFFDTDVKNFLSLVKGEDYGEAKSFMLGLKYCSLDSKRELIRRYKESYVSDAVFQVEEIAPILKQAVLASNVVLSRGLSASEEEKASAEFLLEKCYPALSEVVATKETFKNYLASGVEFDRIMNFNRELEFRTIKRIIQAPIKELKSDISDTYASIPNFVKHSNIEALLAKAGESLAKKPLLPEESSFNIAQQTVGYIGPLPISTTKLEAIRACLSYKEDLTLKQVNAPLPHDFQKLILEIFDNTPV